MNSLSTSIATRDHRQTCGQAIRARRGSLMVEMVVCTVLLSVVAAMLAPAIHAVKRQRIANRFETLAVIELNNVVASIQTAADLQTDAAELSGWFSSRYPNAEMSVETLESDSDEHQVAKKITISRQVFDTEIRLSHSLTTWVAKESAE